MTYKTYPYCITCKAWDKPLHNNSINKSKNITSISLMCRDCRRVKQNNYYKRNPQKIKEIVARSIAKYPEKQKARMKLNDNIRRGKITKPDNCSQCNQTGRIEGHHHDYSKPLEVTWLCSGCHSNLKS